MLELSHLDSEQVNYVGGIHRSGQLLLTLIEDVLDISKIEAGKVKLESIPFRLK
jgi:signal transduction histidine kinase